ncbi:MAG: DUF86 domain-containing protein [Candidatus Aminicenantes bacterium]|nr:DUF86 domain-containing protein [Candidatus Aminicenantes bacterium]
MIREFADRLVRHISFLEAELEDYIKFKKLTRPEYLKERDKRRNVERWIENIINSTVDISRVILNIEGIPIPDTYRRVVAMVSTVEGLEGANAEKLSKWVRFRNVVAHEYLDIKWSSITKFINESERPYKNFIPVVKKYLENRLDKEEL